MLLNDFFEISKQDFDNDRLNVEVKLQVNHTIFQGHFPDLPVVPGVIQLEIVKEILERFLHSEIRLTGLKTCKFLKVINPQINQYLRFELLINCQEVIHVNVVGKTDGEAFLKAHLDYNTLHL